ncbi:ubiquitin carboxyl-terminal hydrolase 30-like [Paramacrobiotus metropolitanus]|uniref:ubiquitin carboxyl-terminal hydrolase 30-like n=1 Tax=Paramacrobiotus metropolitanus TaxID=2943436 RepID=UPI00244579D9|nr:ubiquitin carboxyl-terminal hydrolase 30-like [Paramacrobiotus metropolitanus]
MATCEMPLNSPSPEFLVCAGAFASVLVLKYWLSRESDRKDSEQRLLSSIPLKNPSRAEADARSNDGPPTASLEPSAARVHSGSHTEAPECAPNGHVSGISRGLIPVNGLENLGNTCYINSLIQAVICIPEFISWMRRSQITVCRRQETKNCGEKQPLDTPVKFRRALVPASERRTRNFFHSLLRLEEVLGYRNGANLKRYAAASLISAMFDGLDPTVCHYQQDPDELFLYMMNLLSKSWNLNHTPLFPFCTVGDYFRGDPSSVQIAVSVAGAHLEDAPPSSTFRPWMSLPFQGLLHQDLLCVICRRSRAQPLECFNSLSVSLPAGRHGNLGYTLEALLGKYFLPDDLDAVECPHCIISKTSVPQGKPSLTPHLKRTSIARFPKVLCIHIRRTVWGGTYSWKRRDPVNFSANLFLNEFSWAKHVGANDTCSRDMTGRISINATSNSSSHEARGVYILKSVIVHVGESSSRGHIVAYRKGPVGSRNADWWYYTSDDVVRQTTWNEVENADPYMLFYELSK